MDDVHQHRIARLQSELEEREVDLALVLLPSSDLEYFTGFPRRTASFGAIEYANQWAAVSLIPRSGDPVFLVPQGYSSFNLSGGIDGDVVHIRNVDDAAAKVSETLARFSTVKRLAVSSRTTAMSLLPMHSLLGNPELVDLTEITSRMRRIKDAKELETMRAAAEVCDRVMKEITPMVAAGAFEAAIAAEVDVLMRAHGGRCPSFDTGVFAMGPGLARDASTRIGGAPLREGLGVSFDFGTVIDGYCSDFGRTIHIGEPSDFYRDAYEAVIAAQEAGRQVAVPGTPARDVHAAVQGSLDAAGFGEHFRHRTGHCIGLDTHERPFISEEEQILLEENMTFTLEPSIFWPEHVGVRVEDIFVCKPGGAESLNSYSYELVAV